MHAACVGEVAEDCEAEETMQQEVPALVVYPVHALQDTQQGGTAGQGAASDVRAMFDWVTQCQCVTALPAAGVCFWRLLWGV